MSDVFAGLTDQNPARGLEARKALLRNAKRGFCKLRKIFVQRPDTEPVRASVLADLVRGRQEKALDALLLLLALEPILAEPLRLATWASLLSSDQDRCTSTRTARAFEALVERNLVTGATRGRYLEVHPLLEDGSGRPWDSPGRNQNTIGKGYFTIPDAYWTSGLADRLSMPGKAMFLIMLSETTTKPTFSMAVQRAPGWYGISERTAERGYQQLRSQCTPNGGQLLREHCQLISDARSPTGLREVWHRALADPFSKDARRRLQRASARATVRHADKKAASTVTNDTPTTVKKTTARKTSGAAAQ